MNQEFMKKKPILPLVISMALPMTISMLVNALYNIVDGYFVAKISEDAMTALSLVFPLQNVLTAITVGFGIGINAVVAFYLGANDKKNADTAASLGMFFNIIHGVVLTVLFLTTIPVFLKLFTGNKDVISSGMQYSYVVFSFCIPVSISMTFEKTFQAVGRMKVSMICMMAGCVTNIILDPLFIFGAGFIPAMGIKGAAIATVTGQCVTLLAYFLFYTFSSVPVRFSLKELHFDGKICKNCIQSVFLPVLIWHYHHFRYLYLIRYYRYIRAAMSLSSALITSCRPSYTLRQTVLCRECGLFSALITVPESINVCVIFLSVPSL